MRFTRLFAAAAILLAAGEVRAEDAIAQKLVVTPGGADQMFAALSVPAPIRHNKKKEHGCEVGVGWDVIGQREGPGYWFVRGQLRASFRVEKDRSHGILDWIARAVSPTPGNETVTFTYDKPVLVYCDRSDPGKPLVTVSMLDAKVTAGTYNLMVEGKGRSDVQLPSLSVSSKSFGFSVGYDRSSYKVAVVGLPYVMTPEVTLDAWSGTALSRLHMGFRWESKGEIRAEPVDGVANEYKLTLSYSGSDTKGEVGSSNAGGSATLKASGDGSGLAGAIDFDETETSAAYDVSFSSDMSWLIDVTGGAAPILELGDAHWQDHNVQKWGRNHPKLDGGSVPVAGAPLSGTTCVAAPARAAASAPPALDAVRAVYGTDDSETATSSTSTGLVGTVTRTVR